MGKEMKKNGELLKFVAIIGVSVLVKLLLPEYYDLTPIGITYLAIFIGSILCWMFVDTVWPSVLAMAMLIMCGVLNIGQVGAGSIGNILVITLMCATVIAGKLREYGVLGYMARWAISRKIVHGRPYVFCAIWCIAIYAVVAMSGHLFAYILFIPMIHEISAEIGIKKGDKFFLMLILLTLWSGVIAEGVFPFTAMTTLTGINMLTGLGYPFSAFGYLKISILPGLLVPIILALLVCRFALKPDVSCFANYDDEAARQGIKADKISLQGKITMTIFVMWMIFSAVIPGISALGGFAVWASKVTLAGFILFAIALMCIIRVDGKPIINLNEDYTYVPWGAVIFTSAIMLYSGTMTNESFGIVSSLTKVLLPVANSLSLPMVIVIGAVFVTVLSNFTSNTVSCVIGLTTFVPILQQLGATSAQIYCAGTLIIMMCSVAFLTPSATAGTPIIMGREASMKEMFKYSFIYILLMLIMMLLIYGLVIPKFM